MALTTDHLRPDPMAPAICRMAARRQETPDTFTLTLHPSAEGFSFRPGQFNMLYAFGVGEAAISISGDPADSKAIVHTIRAVGAVTRALDKLGPGDAVGVRGPFGSAWPLREAEGKDVVLVAGGIGLAPLRPALLHLLSNRDRYQRIALLYGARNQTELLYQQELREWRSRFDLTVGVTVDRATEDWYGSVGVVTKLIVRAPFDPANTIAMVCGPEVMMRFGIQELTREGMPDEAIYVSMERNMKCGIGFCGHCQYGPEFVCKDGPVFRYDRVRRLFTIREV